MSMTAEDAAVCLCTRQHFSDAHREALETIDQNHALNWEAIFETANIHGVSPLVYSNLQKVDLDIPLKVQSKFKNVYIHNVFVKRRTAGVLDRVLDLFAECNIALMLVKGEALNLSVYHRPWYTISFDIDIVIKSREEELSEDQHHKISDALNALNDEGNPFQEKIEYDYFEHHDVNLNGVLAVDANRIWEEARRIEFHGRSLHLMTPEDTLIAAAVQSCRKRFFKLKPACDIAEIVCHYPEMNWEVLITKAREYKCNSILYTAFVVAQTLLGCDLPQEVLGELGVNPIRTAVIRRLIRNLIAAFNLDSLTIRSESILFGRDASWPLLLTYATYRIDHIIPKLGEIYEGRRRLDMAR